MGKNEVFDDFKKGAQGAARLVNVFMDIKRACHLYYNSDLAAGDASADM